MVNRINPMVIDVRRNPRKTPDPIGVHLSHCYQGEYEGYCKYGDDNCPAKPAEISAIVETRPMDVYETAYLPVADVPPGDGWELVTGNATDNLWRRPGPLLVAAMAVLDAYHGRGRTLDAAMGDHMRYVMRSLEVAVHAATA